MSTLLLRLAGPMQSWGTQSRFSVRDTGLEPSKSGVIGILCAALGKPRYESAGDGFPTLAELAALKMGVRVNREGVPQVDYHTAGGSHRQGHEYGVVKASGKPGDTVTSHRHYLADADFLVGLESADEELLHKLDAALARPRWQLFLGRKSFVPGVPVGMPEGVRAEPLESLLRNYVPADELVPRSAPAELSQKLRLVLDVTNIEDATEVRADIPVSFVTRRFTLRYVRTGFIDNPLAHAG
jgi:CRISPR system Cascade subunit CasD